MMMGRACWTIGGVLLALLASSLPARAQTPEDRDRALAAVRDGNRLLDAGDYAGALARFQRAFALVPSPKLHFNLGQAFAGLAGREADAYEAFSLYLAGVAAPDSATRAEATRQLASLRAKVALFTVRTDPAGVDVTVDGRPRGITPLARALTLGPGAHEVSLAKTGLGSVTDTVNVAAGEELVKSYALVVPPAPADLRADLRPDLRAPEGTPARQAPPSSIGSGPGGTAVAAEVAAGAGPGEGADPRGADRARTMRVAGIALGGGGLALAVTGVVLHRVGASKLDSIMNAARTGGMYDESDGSYRTFGQAGVTLMVAGGAAAVTGVVLYLLGRRDRDAGAAGGGAQVSAAIGAAAGGGASLHVGGIF